MPAVAGERLTPENARSYQRPGAVDRIFAHALAFLVWIGLIRSHFYVLKVRGRKEWQDNLAAGGPDRSRWEALPGLRPRRIQLGAQCPYGRRSRAGPRDAPSPLVAHCRSGTRSALLWALVRMREGAEPLALVAEAARHGIDIGTLPAVAARLR